MTQYRATVSWRRGDAAFTDNRYSRAHRWQFDGGAEVAASSSPHHVPLPMSDPRGVDPDATTLHALHEEAHAECFLARSVRCEVTCEPAAG